MPIESIAQGLIGVIVFGGLLFHERIAERLASLDGTHDYVDPDEIE